MISVCETIDTDMVEKLHVGPEGEAFLRSLDHCDGSIIVGPHNRVVALPIGGEEAILFAKCNLEL